MNSSPVTPTQPNQKPAVKDTKKKPRVLISAAHTSSSPGEIFEGLREYDLTKKMLEFTVKHLETTDTEFKPVPVDLQLLKRIDWINNTGYSQDTGDIMIELHVNDGGKRGLETWYSDAKADDNESQRLAEILTDNLSKSAKIESQGVKSEFEHDLGSLLILNQTKTISIAIEILYIDNEKDRKILQDDAKLEDICKKLVDAISEYMKEVEKKPAKPKKGGAGSFASGLGNFGGGLGSSFGSPGGSLGGGRDPFSSPIGGGLGSGGGAFGGKDPLGGDTAGGAGGSKSGLTMDREERKKMIEEAYDKYLGNEPKKTDVEYFLNMGIAEDELLMKIIKSKDHEEAIENAKEHGEMKEKQSQQEAELIDLKAKVKELTSMYQNFQMLLAHKNDQIKQMQHELVNNNVIGHGEYYDPNKPQLTPQANAPAQPRPQNSGEKGFLARLLGN